MSRRYDSTAEEGGNLILERSSDSGSITSGSLSSASAHDHKIRNKIQKKPQYSNQSFEKRAEVMKFNEVFENIPVDLLKIIHETNYLKLRQHASEPLLCGDCFTPTSKSYAVYADVYEIFHVREVSAPLDRWCCAPNHSLSFEITEAQASSYSSDESYHHQDPELDVPVPVLFSMQRDVHMGYNCCSYLPVNWWCSGCPAGINIYNGQLTQAANTTEYRNRYSNRHNAGAQQWKLIGSVKQQQCYGGSPHCFTPVLFMESYAEDVPSSSDARRMTSIDATDNEGAFAMMQGPCCFGGVVEFFSKPEFLYTSLQKKSSSVVYGDIALCEQAPPSVVTAEPDGSGGIFGKNIPYALNFPHFRADGSNEKLSVAKKLTVLAAQLLTHQMYYLGNSKWRSTNCNFCIGSNETTTCPCSCWCCYPGSFCTCFGKMIPCCWLDCLLDPLLCSMYGCSLLCIGDRKRGGKCLRECRRSMDCLCTVFLFLGILLFGK